ncbi:MAG: hypothetical protein Q8Q04_01985 [archaeon]|nr:hypothetical protein [archaeon]
MVNLRNIEEIIKDIKSLIPRVDKEIKSFIKSKPLDKSEIERMLDYLMNPFLEKQFNKLINYYKIIDKAAAEDYKKSYKEMYS